MRRMTFIWLTALVLATTSLAQAVREMPHRQPSKSRANAMRGERKLHYLIRQVDLNDKDREFAEGLLEVYRQAVKEQAANTAGDDDLVERVRTLYTRMQEAQKAGNKEEAERLREQMKTLGPGVTAERDFFDSFRAILSEQQSAELDAAIARLKSAPDGALRPVDVLNVARALNLTSEQLGKLSDVLRESRGELSKLGGAPDDDAHEAALKEFIGKVRAVLTPEQAGKFDKQVERMRPEPAAAGADQESDEAESGNGPMP